VAFIHCTPTADSARAYLHHGDGFGGEGYCCRGGGEIGWGDGGGGFKGVDGVDSRGG